MFKPFSVKELREAFLGFFAAKGCAVHPSAPLVPENDPTTLFTVAGMAQFKDMFLGRGTHPFTRATTCQKCIRTNDILNVGRTPRHHTFFEMLGNFSFDDYFKSETIHWAWEFLTEHLGLDPERLSVSVNQRDDEAARIWLEEIGLPGRRLFRLGDDDNFWPASAPTEGPTGPGGNCSEIFWDYRTNDDPDDDLTKDSGRFVEIWNLVFPQFNVTEPKVGGRYTLDELGRTNIDTGMGLERMACVLQGQTNNFDVDLLQTIVLRVCAVAEVDYLRGAEDRQAEGRNVLLRRVADHVRAVSFCIADGALPGNTGRGYIVRRLVRRATLDIDRLGVADSRLHEVVGAVCDAMGDPYEEVVRRRALIEETFKSEETNFRRTLGRGLELFHRALARHRQEGASTFSGDDAFELFTTYGFPVEMTAELAEGEGLPVDQERFRARMEDFAVISRGDRSDEVFQASALIDAKPELKATPFIGYDCLEAEVTVRLLEHEGVAVDAAPSGSAVRFALDRTPFYAESGGQVADHGRVVGEGFEIRVDDVEKDEGLVVHYGTVVAGSARPGPARAAVDVERRRRTTRHHSATHLMHAALVEVLGDHVEQQGSQVSPEALRFDFNHPKALTPEESARVEELVNQAIKAGHLVEIEELPIDEARRRGAKAQFGEKYGEVVRVVTMGSAEVSIEFCGGCHVADTADLGSFRIVREEASSAGIRRLQAVAGEVAAALDAEEQAIADRCAAILGLERADRRDVGPLARLLKAPAEALPERLAAYRQQADDLAASAGAAVTLSGGGLLDRHESLQGALKRLRKVAEQRAAAQALDAVDGILASRHRVAGVDVLVGRFEGVDGKALRQVVERVGQASPSHLLVLGSTAGGKALLLVAATADVIAHGIRAGEVVGRLAKLVGGGGGGKPDLAQAGGKVPERLDDCLAAVDEVVADLGG